MVCFRYEIPLVGTLEELTETVKQKLEKAIKQCEHS